MTRESFIELLKEHNIPFEEIKLENNPEYDGIYVWEKEAYNKKHAHPRKYKDLHVWYIRVSHFDDDMWYVRENGYVSYWSRDKVFRYVLKELAS